MEIIKLVTNKDEIPSYRFVLESFLFNYPFSSITFLQNVILLPAFTALKIKNEVFTTEKYENVYDWFCIKPHKGRKEPERLAGIFLEEVKPYLSSSGNVITFTGGFDGRTLVSAALMHQADFTTFSLGRPENDDVQNPMANAKGLGIPYEFIDLGGTAFKEQYYSLGLKMSKRTGGFNGFLYPHFLLGAMKASHTGKYLLTGYCGSELFRALHIQGAVTSRELVNIFRTTDDTALRDSLWNSEKLALLDKELYREAFEEMMNEIFSFRRNRPSGITHNQFFYYYVFTEVFRKVFGSLTLAQFDEVNVRLPFLDYSFIQELLKTEYAGCNNDFFVHDPFKRIKGQLVYAAVIQQASPAMYRLYTGKGYRPCDLMSPAGKLRIILPYIKKKFTKNTLPQNMDNLGLVSGYLAHRERIEKNFEKLAGFNHSALLEASRNLNKHTPEAIRDRVFLSASLASIL